jgi:protein-S-isoprenylcysteine O-methyltransferase Ste14
MSIFKANNGMNIVGQGVKIILFASPPIAAAILAGIYFPEISALPAGIRILLPLAYTILAFGMAMWGAGLFQLVRQFPKGKLITGGAYGICRNPIYSSCIFFIFPALGIILLNWVFFTVPVFLVVAVYIFIGKEEKKLEAIFGQAYIDYKQKVGRIVPFLRPRSKGKKP